MSQPVKPTKRICRRRFLKRSIFATVSLGAAALAETFLIEPEWPQIVRLDLHLPNLPPAFTGKSIAHISDLHLSRTVRSDYLADCIEHLNALAPDIVVLTGDYITHRSAGTYHLEVVDLIGNIKSPHGVYACLGNHDYGISSRLRPIRPTLQQHFLSALPKVGVNLLRNAAVPLELSGERLWLVGLGDRWAKDCHPHTAFADVPPDESVITLVHNPDAVYDIIPHPTDAILCGHTHGGQINIPFIGPPILPIRHKQFAAGMFRVNGKQLYVNRGLGRLGRMRFNCRPEITIFTLKA